MIHFAKLLFSHLSERLKREEGSILPPFYEQLLGVQIPKAQKALMIRLSFLRFWDLRA